MLVTAPLAGCAGSDRADLKRDTGISLRAEDELALIGNETHDGYRAIVKVSPRNRPRIVQAIYSASDQCRTMVPQTGGCAFMHEMRSIFVRARPDLIVVDVL